MDRSKARKAVLRIRQAMNACQTEIVAGLREFDEALGGEFDEDTPVRPPSQTTLQAAKGMADRVGRIFDKEKGK